MKDKFIDNHIGGPMIGIAFIGRLCSLTIEAEGACVGIGEVWLGGGALSHGPGRIQKIKVGPAARSARETGIAYPTSRNSTRRA